MAKRRKTGASYSKQVKRLAKQKGIDLNKNRYHKPPKPKNYISNTKMPKSQRKAQKRGKRYLMLDGKKYQASKQDSAVVFKTGAINKFGQNGQAKSLSNSQRKKRAKALKHPNSSFGQRYKQQQKRLSQQFSTKINKKISGLVTDDAPKPEQYAQMYPFQPEINSYMTSDQMDRFASILNELNVALAYLDLGKAIKVPSKAYNFIVSKYVNDLRQFSILNDYYDRNDWYGRDNKYGNARKDMGYRLMKDFVWPNTNNVQNTIRALETVSKTINKWLGDFQIAYYDIMG